MLMPSISAVCGHACGAAGSPQRALMRLRLPGKTQILDITANGQPVKFIDAETFELPSAGNVDIRATVE